MANENEALIPAPEACRRLGVSSNTLDNYLKQGLIQVVMCLGSGPKAHRLFAAEDVERLRVARIKARAGRKKNPRLRIVDCMDPRYLPAFSVPVVSFKREPGRPRITESTIDLEGESAEVKQS